MNGTVKGKGSTAKGGEGGTRILLPLRTGSSSPARSTYLVESKNAGLIGGGKRRI